MTLHKSPLHTHRARQSCLFVARKYALQRTMLYRVVNENGHLHGHTDTVIGAQRSSFGTQPFAIHISLDRVVHKVVLHVGILLANHIGMALENNGGMAFHTRGGGLADNHVAHFVHFGFQSVLFAKLHKIFNDFLLVLARTRHFIDSCKQVENGLGLKICSCCHV